MVGVLWMVLDLLIVQVNLILLLDLPIIGGFGKFGAKEELRKIIKLKPHYRLRITFLWVKIDSWDNEAAILYIDGR